MMSKASSSNILAEQSQFKGPRNSMVYKRNNKSVQSTRAQQQSNTIKSFDVNEQNIQMQRQKNYSNMKMGNENQQDSNTSLQMQPPIIRNMPRQTEVLKTQKSGTSLSIGLSSSSKKPPMNPGNLGSSFTQVAQQVLQNTKFSGSGLENLSNRKNTISGDSSG